MKAGEKVDQVKLMKKDVQPWFELEDFMNFSHETRIEGAAFEKLAALWADWSQKLNVCQMENGDKSWLAVWLPEEVETEVDQLWAESPSLGFMINTLAQYLCMSAIQELVPLAAEGGCAPSPKPEKALLDALAMAGLDYHNGEALERRYAVLTYYPFKGGCEVCHLRPSCPKGNGAADSFASIVLPGYEKGIN